MGDFDIDAYYRFLIMNCLKETGTNSLEGIVEHWKSKHAIFIRIYLYGVFWDMVKKEQILHDEGHYYILPEEIY